MIQVAATAPIFGDLSEADLRLLLTGAEAIELAPHEYLFRAGDPADAFFIIETGNLQVVFDQAGGAPEVLAVLGPGELVGELALLYGGTRSASVCATAPARLLKFRRDGLSTLLDENAALRARFVEVARQRLPSLHLAALPMFAGLDRAALDELDLESNWLRIPGGETLFSQGDAPDYLYVLVRGRLELVVTREGGAPQVVGQLSAGALVGEVAVLSGEPRTATVRAIRDSELVRLSRDALERFLQRHPAGALEMLRVLARRVRPVAATPPHQLVASIAVIPAGVHPDLGRWTEDLAAALCDVGGPALLVDRRRVDDYFHAPVSALEDDLARARVDSWIHTQENRCRYVIFAGDAAPSPWTSLCLRQADLILVVAAAGGEPERSPLHEQLFDADGARSAAVQLVLLHPAETVRPTGTARWLNLFPVARHHHVRIDRLEDTRRVARFIAGKSVSAAFSGGGARALGHIGVVRALVDSGVPIDAVAGVSAGCFASALYAMGHDYETMLAVSDDSVGRYSARQEATLPIVSFLSGRRTVEMLRQMFDVQIEDLWVPFCCLSTNLTRAEIVTHDRGPLWLAVRASTSVPGVAPPVCVGGELLVDGGVLNNLPADVLRQRFGGIVIAVDVSLAVDLKTDLDGLLALSGWSLMWQRLRRPAQSAPPLPHIFEILMRTALLSSVHHGATIAERADFYMRLPVEGVATLDWKAGPPLIERCYQFARQEIARWNIGEKLHA